MPAPEGAQLSEDGSYWWDTSSNEWKSVADTPADAASSAGATAGASAPAGTQPEGQLSEDGNYRWDGSQWQPGEAGTAGAAGDQGGAASEGTVQIPSDVLDQLVNFSEHFPETAALCQYDGNMEGYATAVLALSEIPSEHTDEALA